MARKTWKILKWTAPPDHQTPIDLACWNCGNDADLPMGPTPGGILIAAIGLGLIFDPPNYQPPPNTLPDEIQCRKCKTIWGPKEERA